MNKNNPAEHYFWAMILACYNMLLTFWNGIAPADTWLLTHINQNWGNPFFDMVLPFMRETLFWTPLYLFLLLFVTINFGKKGWWFVLAAALTAALSDIVSSHVVKQLVIRARPCQDPAIASQLRFFINYCPGSSSFMSSHATSHFAQATFFYMTLRTVMGAWASVFFLWAAIIAYTQVYVGVHYPFDVLCGSLTGMGLGYIVGKMFHRQIGLLSVS